MENPNKSIDVENISSFLEIAETLGFVETTEMKTLRTEIVEHMQKGTDFIASYMRYEEEAKKEEWIANPEGQISLMIMKALMLRDGGDQESFEEEVEHVTMYASRAATSFHQNLTNIAETINRLKT